MRLINVHEIEHSMNSLMNLQGSQRKSDVYEKKHPHNKHSAYVLNKLQLISIGPVYTVYNNAIQHNYSCYLEFK